MKKIAFSFPLEKYLPFKHKDYQNLIFVVENEEFYKVLKGTDFFMNEHEAPDNITVQAYKLDKTNTQKDGTEEYDLVDNKPIVLQINKLSHIHIKL